MGWSDWAPLIYQTQNVSLPYVTSYYCYKDITSPNKNMIPVVTLRDASGIRVDDITQVRTEYLGNDVNWRIMAVSNNNFAVGCSVGVTVAFL